MIILHISDIHYDKALLSEIKNRNYDVLCISGDLLAEPGCTPINVQINEIISILKKVKKTAVYSKRESRFGRQMA